MSPRLERWAEGLILLWFWGWVAFMVVGMFVLATTPAPHATTPQALTAAEKSLIHDEVARWMRERHDAATRRIVAEELKKRFRGEPMTSLPKVKP